MSIFKRGGVYWFNFWFNGHHVQRSTKQRNANVARQMEAAHRTLLAKGELGLEAPPPVPTLGEFLENEFLPWAETTFSAKPKTFAWYRVGVRRLMELDGLRTAKLDQITGDQVRAYVAHRQRQRRVRIVRTEIPEGERKAHRGRRRRIGRESRPFTITAINRELQVLRRALRLALEWGRAPRIAKVTMLPGETRRERVLTFDEENAYVSNAAEPMRSVATVLVDSGLRPEECFRLRWDYVTFDNGRHGTMLIPHGKTAAARRQVPFTPRVRALLEDRWKAAGMPTQGWVFPAPTKSGHVEPSTLRGPHRNAIEAARLQPFVLYTFRHTFLTRLGESGCDVWTLARVAGHSTVAISGRYVHPSDDAVQRAFSRMQDVKELPAP